MSSFIETLNLWGQHTWHFAGPMLWQSSLLIVVVFALDYALRRKVRASVRYALWFIVLFKLVLPPSLSSPTSLAWWLREPTLATAVPLPAPTPLSPPLIAPVHSIESESLLQMPAVAAPSSGPVSVHLSITAWLLVLWTVIGFGLLGWLGVRWRQVARQARVASTPPLASDLVSVEVLLKEAKGIAGVRQAVECRLIDRSISPSLCGLFRPIILLPRLLADRLPPAQLQAVLLHELIHLRRRDVWINLVQALIQIVYWWHPLLWFANARIRRLREEAVDDAVMLALAERSDTYPPTLVEVAKLAFQRPLASLGLVGIFESRRGLRQRIERLMNFKTPGRASFPIAAVVGIAAFAAIAVPMGEPKPVMAPVAQEASPPSAPSPTTRAITNEQFDIRADESSSFVTQSGRLHVIEARTNLIAGSWIELTNFTGDGTLKQFTFSTTNPPVRFFRVRTQ